MPTLTLTTYLQPDLSNNMVIKTPALPDSISDAVTKPTKPPSGRFSGFYGFRRIDLLQKARQRLRNQKIEFVRVNIHVPDVAISSNKQTWDRIKSLDVLNLFLISAEFFSDSDFRNALDIPSSLNGEFAPRGMLDNEALRSVSSNPERLNKLFDLPSLSHIKAILWGIPNGTESGYHSIVTLRDVTSAKVEIMGQSEGVSTDILLES